MTTSRTAALSALNDLDPSLIPGVYRIENTSREEGTAMVVDMLRSVYPHQQIYGDYITVQDYIDCPPRELYDYLADTRSLEEWTGSLRGFTETDEPGLWVAYDRIDDDQTEIYTRTVANREAMTVDYHCAWDQGTHLWMIYLMRVIDAQVVLDRPGSLVLWTNCRHPFYEHNPFPETAPADRATWVGDLWDMFPAGHLIELHNLKAIAEYRHANGLPVTPQWMQ
ncbi:SRPBCC family protein [Rhodococcus sp. NPDC127528]|uniref:SRPBCC family protein n=1 Tax=unclassified Rhodococcus (in: high G+C Gram-positive bacteria) TaxID=192944 RepID=UPI00362C6559